MYFVQCDAPVSVMTVYPIQSEEGGIQGIFREDAEDTGTYLRGNHGSKVSKSQKCEKNVLSAHSNKLGQIYVQWDAKLKFKICLSLFSCAEKCTVQRTHCAV